MSKENQRMIRMHLEQHIYETCTNSHYVPGWHEIMAFCLGYYNYIDLDIIAVVKELQVEGIVE